jgi:branched-chain amino acid:cation transporter, LIVCS family
MHPTKQTLLIAFALFSLFFGAGNLILPPFLGYNAGIDWPWVLLGFALSAVVIPILAIYGYARIQGSMLDFASKLSSPIAILYCVIMYAIAISLPAPRTAAVTYEIAIAPYIEISALSTSILYFAGVLLFALNRTQIISMIGKFITPLIILILLVIIGIGLFAPTTELRSSIFDNTFSEGILEGYQTFDAIGGVVVGGVIVISLLLQAKFEYKERRLMIARAGVIAGFGLFLIYGGLIALGAVYSSNVSVENRTQLLSMISNNALGDFGAAFLSVLVALACFTTAVGIVTGTADFIKELLKGGKRTYQLTVIIGCTIGVLVGQFNVAYIIDIALPSLMFIYPITIVLIFLNALPDRFTSVAVFRAVAIVTFIFSIPDFLQYFTGEGSLDTLKSWIPLAELSMGWVLPALITFLLMNMFATSNAARNIAD